ncbi:hypothetical protein MFUM_980016 [Methylacidiphilum fumariolicum SolV]|uniref:Uncharacterized protein n=2 Tax=Candidatus Methylacidiphilum fumarolicum TaxID=591154 RepID=I0K1H9_METFB|nr:conserved protein of unknown function [Candidatus Methylacidiphilum fumarolicum]CCG93348.1 hypothetical protein MFUM_980016 [Methylacidiphilum fumariolicum SolV]
MYVDSDIVNKHVRQAHENIIRAFEASITDQLCHLFELED